MRSTTLLVIWLLAFWAFFLIMGCAPRQTHITVQHPGMDMVTYTGTKTVAFRVYIPYHILNRAVILRVMEREGFFTSSYRDMRGVTGVIAYVVTFNLPAGRYGVEGILIRVDGDDKWYRGRLHIQ